MPGVLLNTARDPCKSHSSPAELLEICHVVLPFQHLLWVLTVTEIFHGFYLLLMKGLRGSTCFSFSHRRLSLSFAENPYWVRLKTSQSTSRISSGFQSLNSPSKWHWLLLCLWLQGTMSQRELRHLCVPIAASNNSVVQRPSYLYQHVHCTEWDSDTVIWDVLDSGPCPGQVSDRMKLARRAVVLLILLLSKSYRKAEKGSYSNYMVISHLPLD